MAKVIITYTIDVPITLDIENIALTLRFTFPYQTAPIYAKAIGATLYNNVPFRHTPQDIVLTDITTTNIVDIAGTDYYRIILEVYSSAVDRDDLMSATLGFVEARLYNYTGQSPLYKKYNALHNFYDGYPAALRDDDSYNSPFRTSAFGHSESTVIDLKLQPSYDGSTNMIFTDNVHGIKTINSRFVVNDTGSIAYKAERRHKKDSNTYSNEEFHRTNLFPSYLGVPVLDFTGVKSGGSLTGGGYRYFFRYATQDGDETDIIAESRLVEIHFGNDPYTAYGAKDTEKTSNSVTFRLSELDTAFHSVKVYYTQSVGTSELVSAAYSINNTYKISDNGEVYFTHTGYEPTTSIAVEELSVDYSSVSKGKTLDVVNNRLLVGNTASNVLFNDNMAKRAASTVISEAQFDIKHNVEVKRVVSKEVFNSNYANPDFTYNRLGYWKGETYELGVVFVGENGTSPVYPLHGADAKSVPVGTDIQASSDFNRDLVGNFDMGFDSGVLSQNSNGAYRTKFYTEYYDVDYPKVDDGAITFKGTALKVNVEKLLGYSLGIKFATMNQSSSDPGFTLCYSDGQYRLFGSITETHNGGHNYPILSLNDIPVTTGIQQIPFVNYDGSEGVMAVDTSALRLYILSGYAKNGTVLTTQDGVGPDRDTSYNSFFFVRKQRKKDMLVDGIFTPAAAIPPTSSYSRDSTPFLLPSYTGVGVTSELFGGNVSFVPAPACLLPYGKEREEEAADMLLRAPVKDFNDARKLAFYSADIDIAPARYATVFTGGVKGMMYTNMAMPFRFALDFDPPEASYNIPYAIELGGYTADSYTATNFSMTGKPTYIDPKTLGTSGGGFSGKFDRNLSLALRLSDTCDIYKPSFYIFRQDDGNALHTESGRHNEWVTKFSDVLYEDALAPTRTDATTIYPSISPKRAPSSAVAFSRYIGVDVSDGWSDARMGNINLMEVPVNTPTDYVEYTNNLNCNYQMTFKSGSMALCNYIGTTEPALGYQIKQDGSPVDLECVLQAVCGTTDYTQNKVNIKSGDYTTIPTPGSLLKINWGSAGTSYHIFDQTRIGTDNHYALYPNPPAVLLTGTIFELNSSNTQIVQQNKSYAMKGFMFDGISASHISPESWRSRYASEDDIKYIAISERFNVLDFAPLYSSSNILTGLKDTNINLYGGDCYLGLAWKQVWSPLGIEEAPQTNDMEPYHIDRKSLGLLSYGFAIPIPAQNNSNFTLRTLERNSDSEYKIYGKDRSFLPLKSSIRGDRQLETGTFNFGYDASDSSDHAYFRIDSSVPFIRTSYPNRVFASEAQEDTQFSSGFKVFKGLDYRDYNYEMGPLTKLMSHRSKTYMIFQNGISVIGVDERSVVGEGDTGGIYVDNVDVLPLKSLPISPRVGSQHLRSIARTQQYIYGVDVRLEKIWRVSSSKVEMISDLKVQSLLTDIIKYYKSLTSTVKTLDVYTSTEIKKGDIYFTFVLNEVGAEPQARTIVFNESLEKWVSETSDSRKFFLNSDGDRIAFSATNDRKSFYIYDSSNIDGMLNVGNRFFGNDYPAIFSFYINNSLEEDKKLTNFLVLGEGNTPESITYSSDVDTEEGLLQTIAPYTNVHYTIPNVTFSGTAGDRFGTLSAPAVLPHSSHPLKPGNAIKVDGDVYTVMNIVDDTTVMLDVPLSNNYDEVAIRFGIDTPLRMANAIKEIGKTKIMCSYKGVKVVDKFRPEGEWINPEFKYNGNYKMNISSIVSQYTADFS